MRNWIRMIRLIWHPSFWYTCVLISISLALIGVDFVSHPASVLGWDWIVSVFTQMLLVIGCWTTQSLVAAVPYLRCGESVDLWFFSLGVACFPRKRSRISVEVISQICSWSFVLLMGCFCFIVADFVHALFWQSVMKRTGLFYFVLGLFALLPIYPFAMTRILEHTFSLVFNWDCRRIAWVLGQIGLLCLIIFCWYMLWRIISVCLFVILAQNIYFSFFKKDFLFLSHIPQ